jgi:hypothetical protein
MSPNFTLFDMSQPERRKVRATLAAVNLPQER